MRNIKLQRYVYETGKQYFSNENNESSMVLQHGSNNKTNFTKQFKEMTQEKLKVARLDFLGLIPPKFEH